MVFSIRSKHNFGRLGIASSDSHSQQTANSRALATSSSISPPRIARHGGCGRRRRRRRMGMTRGSCWPGSPARRTRLPPTHTHTQIRSGSQPRCTPPPRTNCQCAAPAAPPPRCRNASGGMLVPVHRKLSLVCACRRSPAVSPAAASPGGAYSRRQSPARARPAFRRGRGSPARVFCFTGGVGETALFRRRSRCYECAGRAWEAVASDIAFASQAESAPPAAASLAAPPSGPAASVRCSRGSRAVGVGRETGGMRRT